MGFTKRGYIRATAEEIKDKLVNAIREKYPAFTAETADIQNCLLDTEIIQLLELENIKADIANGFSPLFANDFMFELFARNCGLSYKSASKATAMLCFSGQAGTYIPQDTEVTGGFTTDASAIIGTDGKVFVSATSENDGVFEAGAINSLINNIAGVSVTNPTPSVASQAKESLAELRQRAQQFFKNPRIGGIEYATAQLTGLKGVSSRLVAFKFVATDTKRGIEAIIGGGETDEVAKALFSSFLETQNLISNPSDSETQRSVKYIINYKGSVVSIVWTLPKKLNLTLRITIVLRHISTHKGKLEINCKQVFEKLINSLQVGTPINKTLFDKIVITECEKMEIKANFIEKINYEIEINSLKTNFDENGYIAEIKNDCYVELLQFALDVNIGG